MRQNIDNIHEGDVVNRDILNDNGVLLIGRGAVLAKENIAFLKDKGIKIVDIVDAFKPMTDEQMAEAVKGKPAEYTIPQDVLDKAIDSESIFKEEYKAGIDCIRNVDVETTMDVAKGICEKVSSTDNLQEELAMLRNGYDSVLTHSMNVAIMAASIIVWQAGLTKELYYEAVAGAMLHDIGKLYIPRAVLDKPGKLTDDEYAIMKQHPSLGYMKLKSLGNVSERIAQMAYQHHENYDGTGYPNKLKGNEIQKESMIIHIADVYEAMTAKRCYKDPMLPGDVTEFTMSKIGSMFDTEQLRMFLKTVPAYKRGDMVMLSNHQLAQVIASNPLNSLRPKVRVVMTGQELDLFRDKNNLNITIIGMV